MVEVYSTNLDRHLNVNTEWFIRPQPNSPGRVAQSVTCLTADARGREFDPGPVPYFRGD